MATLQNLGVLKYRGKDGNWKPLPVVLQSSDSGDSGGISTISGNGQPTESTVGQLNQLYRDELTDKLYICTGVEGGYTWAAVVSDTEDAVTYTAQTLTEEQKTQARANIGAGTSNFSGSYNDLNDQPNIPAATVIDTTLTKSGYAADAKAAGDAIEKKLDKAQGVENAGMILGVDEDGNVAPENKPVQALAGAAAPTTATAGVVGQEYYVIVNNAVTEMYVCTAVANGTYTWDKVEFGAEIDDTSTEPTKVWSAEKCNQLSEEIADCIKSPTTAEVGQIVKIAAVDDAGKPTAWGAVDMPEEIEWVNATMTFDDNGNPSISSTDISATEVIRRIKEGRCCVVRLTDGDFEFTMMQSSCDEHSASFTTILNNIIYIVGFSTNGNGSDNVILNTNSIGSMLFDLERNSDDPTKATLMYGITLYDINSAIGRNKIVYLRIGKNVYSWSETAPGYKFSTIIEDGNELKYSRITLGGDGNPHSTNATIYEKVL